MATKRQRSPELIPNPFIKKHNREWTLRAPDTPPADASKEPRADEVSSAAIEAGRAAITDHVAHFGAALARATQSPYPVDAPHLSVDAYKELYEANVDSEHGAHFVIHQHDHPVAGTHYDLRLQINGTSSASWAVMYGMPGDPHSIRLARNATETRVHCLWNHLIETASATTGSLLLWDTGMYAVLPRRSKHEPAIDPSSQTGRDDESPSGDKTEQQKLAEAFGQRKIKIRLDGTRLPRPYVLNLRLTKSEDADGRAKAKRSAERGGKRRRRGRGARVEKVEETSSDDEDEVEEDGVLEPVEPTTGQPLVEEEGPAAAAPTEMTGEMRRELEELEDAQVRATNAYIGADNSIGSVHQRKWFLSLDREASGFVRTAKRGGKPTWVHRGERAGADDDGRLRYPFYVRGPEEERSVVTGRLAADVLRDEGVGGFIGRKGWRPVLR